MNRQEAFWQLESLLDYCESMRASKTSELAWTNDCTALKFAISALRGPTREQVEKVWRGEWEHPGYYDDGGGFVHDCSKCNTPSTDEYWFCPSCGAPMTDEAVQMVLERMEAMYGEAKAD